MGLPRKLSRGDTDESIPKSYSAAVFYAVPESDNVAIEADEDDPELLEIGPSERAHDSSSTTSSDGNRVRSLSPPAAVGGGPDRLRGQSREVLDVQRSHSLSQVRGSLDPPVAGIATPGLELRSDLEDRSVSSATDSQLNAQPTAARKGPVFLFVNKERSDMTVKRLNANPGIYGQYFSHVQRGRRHFHHKSGKCNRRCPLEDPVQKQGEGET